MNNHLNCYQFSVKYNVVLGNKFILVITYHNISFSKNKNLMKNWKTVFYPERDPMSEKPRTVQC